LLSFSSFKDYVKKYPKNKILETVQFLELRKEVLAEIKEAEAKKNLGRQIDSSSDSDDMTDPMEQVSNLICYWFLDNYFIYFIAYKGRKFDERKNDYFANFNTQDYSRHGYIAITF